MLGYCCLYLSVTLTGPADGAYHAIDLGEAGQRHRGSAETLPLLWVSLGRTPALALRLAYPWLPWPDPSLTLAEPASPIEEMHVRVVGAGKRGRLGERLS